MKAVTITTLALVVASCAPRGASSPEEQAYLDQLAITPMTWKTPKTSLDEMRGKTQVWISKYSPMKVQTVTDYVINTYNATPGRYSYNVTIEPQGDSAEFTIECQYARTSEYDFTNGYAYALRNGRILSLYLQTGKIMPKFIEPQP